MKLLILVLLSLSCVAATTLFDLYNPSNQNGLCGDSTENITLDYRWAISNFNIDLYKINCALFNYHFVYCPFSIWLMLAGIAEGADPENQRLLFDLLNLPNDVCERQKYYEIASTRVPQGQRYPVQSNRLFGFDYSLLLDPYWLIFSLNNYLFNLLPLPIKANPEIAAEESRRAISASLPNIDLTGNSILLDGLDYNGIWDESFSLVEREPFYDSHGVQTGFVDMMKTRRRLRMAYAESIQSKCIELPIGSDGRYIALLAIVVEGATTPVAVDSLTGAIIFELIENLRESLIPIEIEVPQFAMTSEINVREVLEHLGVTNIWTNPSATRLISDPPPFPSSFLQRTSMEFDTDGASPPSEEPEAPIDAETGLDPRVGRDFVANKPILWGIFDTEVYTCMLGSAYSKPIYPL